MSDGSAFDGRACVVDTSAWTRTVRRAAADDWSAAMLAGQLWMTPVEQRLDELREAALDRAAVRTALGALRELAASGPLHHRVPVTDVLIAAAAAERGIGVLHYDEHFDRLALVLGFESRWIVARGRA